MKFSDLGMVVLMIGIIMLMIIPVPLPVLDFFLSMNIALAMLIMLISMFIKEPLEFAIFPSMLLITTLFRLSLNISTTRKILAKGEAGSVIDAFGQFSIGGDAIVGFVIFIIIIVIQFLVITKGAERVSEVAARFTLDAMPGKQMAIDADLNSGIISEAEARERRTSIQKEADFYGAMDGASKFVKGDAIAGIIITIVNIVAGFAIGAFRFGLSIPEALGKYTLLTVGDGLVGQIPALMISVATGIVVTRAASESNLSQDVYTQLFREPKILYIVSGVLAFLGIVTPLPPVPFLMLGGFLSYLAFSLTREVKKALSQETEEDEQAQEEMEDIRKPENIIPLLQVDPIELEFGYGIIPLADPNQGGDLFDRLVMIRRQIALELGVVVPMIRLRDNIQLEPNAYSIKIKGNEVAYGEIMFEHYLAMDPGHVEGEIQGVETVEPAFGLPAKWISSEEREKAEVLGYTVVDPSSIISTHLTEIIKRHAYELLGRQEVKSLIDNVKEKNSTLVDELIPGLLSVGDVQKVLANLLKEGISIRDLNTILEALADNGQSTKDFGVLTEYTRQALSRQITSQYLPARKGRVVTLDGELESLFMEAIQESEAGGYFSLDPQVAQSFLNQIATAVQNLLQMGEQPIVMTAPIVRFYVKKLTEVQIPDLIVLSYNEVESDVDIQSVEVVNVS